MYKVLGSLEETQSLKSLYSFFQIAVYGLVILESLMYVLYDLPELSIVNPLLIRMQSLVVYNNIWISKALIFLVIFITSIGTKPRRAMNLNVTNGIVIPLLLGLIFTVLSIYFYIQGHNGIGLLTTSDFLYGGFTLIGTILVHCGLDNCSKAIKKRLLDDRFNVENESFEQCRTKINTPYSINLQTKFFFQKKIRNGWLNITNPFRGTIVLGTPGSGKSYSIIIPTIKQMVKKRFSMLIYDFKFPDLTQVAYHHFLLNHTTEAKCSPAFGFHMINLFDLEYSRRINPLSSKYIENLADAVETAESMVESLKKTGEVSGADQFFTQSAINFLSACIFFLSKYQNGKFSTLPHIMSLLNRSYDEIFSLLFTNEELESILSPFESAYQNKAFNQLEGQIGTLKVNISRLNTKESAWVFSGEDVDLRISNPQCPSILLIANNPRTQNINSATNSVLLNRISKLVNTRGNHPCGIIIDELPTIYFHRIQNLISTARSHQVAILLGIQELPQLVEGYGRTGADTILGVIGNVISGAVRKKETMDWLEKLFGKIKQTKKGLTVSKGVLTTSYSEHSDFLIPASKIADLQTGHVVGKLTVEALTAKNLKTFKPGLGTYKCSIDLNFKEIEKEKHLYVPLPKYYNFGDKKEEVLLENYNRIKREIDEIIFEKTKMDAKKFAEGKIENN